MLRLQLLGEFCLQDAGEQRVQLTSRKSEWLLAYLALYPTAHPREQLAGLFWPDSEQSKSNSSLRQALYILRPLLERNEASRGLYLHATQTIVQFRKENLYWLDTATFEQLIKESEHSKNEKQVELLQKAIALYRDDLLVGCYEDWCLEARGYFRELYLKALERLMLYHAERKAYSVAIDYSKKILAKQPLNEEAHRHLMYLYYASGDRAAALSQYRDCAAILQNELSVEPLPETKTLLSEIEQQANLTQMETAASRARALIRRYPELSVPFVGRTEESQQFLESWDKVTQNHGKALFVAGEAGVGKSRLAQEWLNFAKARNALVLSGRCYEIEGKLSYQPIIEALRSILSQVTAEILSGVSPIWLDEIVKLAPEFASKISHAVPEASSLASPLQERNRLFEGLFQFFLTLSQERPLLLFLDDLQWADESTLEFLHYLIRKLPTQKIFFLGTYRVEEVSEAHPLWKQLQHLERDQLFVSLSLEPLGVVEMGMLIYGMLKSDKLSELVSWVYGYTRGIPLFAVEMLKSSIEAGTLTVNDSGQWHLESSALRTEPLPATVRSLIELRLRRLSQPSRQILEIAAVTGRVFTLDLLAQAMGRPLENLFDRFEELLQMRVIIRERDAYNFRHDLIRQVLYSALLAERKQKLHKRIGEALEKLHAHSVNEIAGELAHHYRQAHLWPQAMEYSIRAGEQAWKAYAKQEALDAFHRALELAEKLNDTQGKMRAYKGLGQVCCFTDKHDEGLEYSLEALELCTDPYQRADIYHAISNVYHHKSDFEKAFEYYRISIRELGENNNSVTMGIALDRAGAALLQLRRFDEALEYATRSLAIIEGKNQWSLLSLVYTHLGAAYRGKRDYDQAVEFCIKSVELSERASDINAMATAYWWLALAYSYKREAELAIHWYQKANDAYATMNDTSSTAWCHMYLSYEFMWLKRLDQAIFHTQKKLEIWQSIGNTIEIASALGILGCLYDAKSWKDQAENAFKEALKLATQEGTLFTRIIISFALLDRVDEALSWLKVKINYIPKAQLKYLSDNPWCANLRNDSRFDMLMSQHGGRCETTPTQSQDT